MAIFDGFIGYFKIVFALSFLLVILLSKVLLVARAVEELLLKLVDFNALFTLPFDGHVLHLKLSQRLVARILRLVLGAALSLSLNVRKRTSRVIILELERTRACKKLLLLGVLLFHAVIFREVFKFDEVFICHQIKLNFVEIH